MKIKDLNHAEENDFPCKLRCLGPSKEESNSNCVIGLALFELRRVLRSFSKHALYIEQVFLVYTDQMHKNLMPKNWLM